MSIGVDFFFKSLEIDDFNAKLQIFDIKDEKRFRFLSSAYVKGANGGIIMYDITNHSSFKNIPEWSFIVKENAGEIPIILVGGKSDLAENRKVSSEKAIQISNSLDFNAYIECSSKTGENVEEIFETLTKLMLQQSGLVNEFPEIKS